VLRTFDAAVAIVTGGASGIGRALAESLVARGATVILADRQGDLADEVASKIRARRGQAIASQVDVTDFPAVEYLVQKCVRDFGRLDYQFNNAGIGIGGKAEYYGIDDWNEVLRVNLGGVVNGLQAAYPVMLKQGFGHIVNTASIGGLMPFPFAVGYCASKHGIVGLSTSLRIEAAKSNVRVSALCPGIVRTSALVDCGAFGRLSQSVPSEIQRRGFDRLRPMEPARFAEKALRGVVKNKAIIVVPRWWKLAWYLNRISPALGLYLGRRLLERTDRELAESKDDEPHPSNCRVPDVRSIRASSDSFST